jgi:hypothetical protein
VAVASQRSNDFEASCRYRRSREPLYLSGTSVLKDASIRTRSPTLSTPSLQRGPLLVAIRGLQTMSAA